MLTSRYRLWTVAEDDWLINNYGGLYGWGTSEASRYLRRSYQGTQNHIRALGLRRNGDDWRIEPGCEVAMWRMGEGEAIVEQEAA